MRNLTLPELMDLADPEVHDSLAGMINRHDVAGICVYECLDLGSPEIGQKSFMVFGPGCTTKTIEECYKGHLGDVPSRFRHPVAHYLKELPCFTQH